MEGFEGYIGIQLWNGQLVHDILYALIAVSLFVFAVIFRLYTPQIQKSFKQAFLMKERQNLFDDPSTQKNVFYHIFMNFQALFLSSLILFVVGWNKGLTIPQTFKSIILVILVIFAILLSFFSLKQLLYFVTGSIFTDINKYSFWKTNYNAIIEIWGVTLYIPAIWLIFVGKYVNLVLFFYFILFIASRFLIIYKMLRIFHPEKYGLLYLSLYLCGQEIIPLYILYKGIIYMYNLVEIGILWH